MRKTLIWLGVLSALALAAPVDALASGPGSSAGDNQYVDPLATPTTTTAPAPHTTPSSTPPAAQTTTASPPPSSTPPSSQTTPASSAPQSTPQTTAPQSSPAQSTASTTGSTTSDPTLPYTGLNTWLIAAVGVLLLSAGVAVRRVVWKRTRASRR